MKIAIIGIGLMGGSLCKAIKKHTDHMVYGLDTNPHTISRALECGAIDRAILPEGLADCDLAAICLGPEATTEFVSAHAGSFKRGGTVMDICGVKQSIVAALEPLLSERDINYVGTHPMAGREFSGFSYSDDAIFLGASFIITPTLHTSPAALGLVRELAESIGFGRVVVTTHEDHDKNSAFSSQLAHVVSNAYIKSPSLWNQSGFSAGSFQDLTRVAKLNEEMWASLFLLNQKPLLAELDIFLANLQKYRDALAEQDRGALCELLREGRILKEISLTGDGEKEGSIISL